MSNPDKACYNRGIMEGKSNKPRAILVFGAPASGKTTFCEKFSAQFRAPYYDLLDIEKRLEFDRKKMLAVLDLIAKTGQNLIIEGELNTEADRDEIRKLLRQNGYTPSLIWIQTDVNTIKTRLKVRLKSVEKAKREYETKIAELEAPAEDENSIVLSGKHTFETQLTHVLSRMAELI